MNLFKICLCFFLLSTTTLCLSQTTPQNEYDIENVKPKKPIAADGSQSCIVKGQIMDWKGSPCETLYGPLENVR